MLRKLNSYQEKVLLIILICVLIPAGAVYMTLQGPQPCAVTNEMLSEEFRMAESVSMDEIVDHVPGLKNSYVYYFEERLMKSESGVVLYMELPEEFQGSDICLGFFDCRTLKWTELYSGTYEHGESEQIFLLNSENYGYKVVFLFGEEVSGPLRESLTVFDTWPMESEESGVLPL